MLEGGRLSPMNPHSLALVLIKVLGLSLTITGITMFASGLAVTILVYSNQIQHTLLHTTNSNYLWPNTTTLASNNILYFVLGMFLIIKARYVVISLLKIDPEL